MFNWFKKIIPEKKLYISEGTQITCMNSHKIGIANEDIYVNDPIDGKKFTPVLFQDAIPGELFNEKKVALCHTCNAPYMINGRLHLEHIGFFTTKSNIKK